MKEIEQHKTVKDKELDFVGKLEAVMRKHGPIGRGTTPEKAKEIIQDFNAVKGYYPIRSNALMCDVVARIPPLIRSILRLRQLQPVAPDTKRQWESVADKIERESEDYCDVFLEARKRFSAYFSAAQQIMKR